MYAHDTNQGDADTKELGNVELIFEILQEQVYVCVCSFISAQKQEH